MKVLIMAKNGKRVVDLNRRKAIRERCLNCSAWFYPGVTNCTFTDCPLYPFRSGRGKQNAKARAKAIRKYCLCCMGGQSAEVSKSRILKTKRKWNISNHIGNKWILKSPALSRTAKTPYKVL
jgi:Zn-finger protein